LTQHADEWARVALGFQGGCVREVWGDVVGGDGSGARPRCDEREEYDREEHRGGGHGSDHDDRDDRDDRPARSASERGFSVSEIVSRW
jgi:hypothetical protein